jgi:hypothetical protein
MRFLALLALIALTAGGGVRADSCTECKAQCNQSEAVNECNTEAREPGQFIPCAALLAKCIERCTCPAPERVQACISGATNRHSERAMSCLRQFPTNPTGCMDQNNKNYQSEMTRCKVDP